jgi:hypothetical protein
VRCCAGLRAKGRGPTFVLIFVAVVAGSGAAAYARVATTTVDRSFACSVQIGGGHGAYLDVQAGAKDPPANVAYASVYTANKKRGAESVAQLGFGSASKGLRIDAEFCKRSSAHVPLRSSRLGPGQTVTSSFVGYFRSRCPSARRALVRIRLQEKKGIPVHAQIALISDNAKKSPIADVVWSPTRITYFLAADCA